MTDKEKLIIDGEIANAIIEMPIWFDTGNARLCLYPVTLGKSLIVNKLMKLLEVDQERVKAEPYIESIRLCREHKDTICEILAIHTLNTRDEILDVDLIDERALMLGDKLSEENLAKLFIPTLSDPIELFKLRLGLTEESAEKQRIAVYKNEESTSAVFGGKSIYGTLIDYVCERYKWTMDYVLWGISLINLKMLMSDSITTILLSEKDRKELGLSEPRGHVIDAGDPNNMAKIKEMLRD